MYLDGPRMEMRYIDEEAKDEVNLELLLGNVTIGAVLNAMVSMLRAMSFSDSLIKSVIGKTTFAE